MTMTRGKVILLLFKPERWRRRLDRLWLLFILLLAPMAGAQHFTFSTFGMTSGLTNLNISSLLEDHLGVVWVGTQSGIFVADGVKFHKRLEFTEAGLEYVRVLREDGSGRIWALDNHHLVYLEDGAIHEIAGLKLKIFGSQGVDLISVPLHRDTMYLLRDGELLRIASADQGRSWTVSHALPETLVAAHPELRSVSSIVSGGGETMWVGCGRAICKLDMKKGTVQRFSGQEGLEADVWKRLLVTRSGTLWVRGERRVASLANGATRFTGTVDLPSVSYLNVQSSTLIEDARGNIVLNLAHGIATTQGGGWTIYTQRNGLPDDQADTLMFDRAGDLWVALLGHGLVRWHGFENWEGWTTAEGLSSNIVWSSPRDLAGRSWVTTQTSLDRLDAVTNRITSQARYYPFHRLLSAVVDQRQHVWASNDLGQVLDFDPATGKIRVAAKELGRVFQLLVDREQRIWVGARAGLYVFFPEDGWRTAHGMEEAAAPHGYAWSIAEGHDGTLWVATGHGLFRLRGSAWTAIQLPFPGGTEFNFMIAPALDGTLWVQGKREAPVVHLGIVGDKANVLNRIEAASFGSDNITFMNTDRRGWIWVGGDDGIHVFDGTRWVQCTTEDGLLWDDTDFHGFFADPDGSVWIATSGGLSHLKHPERLFSARRPQVRLVKAQIGTVDLSERGTKPQIDIRRPSLAVSLLNVNYSRETAIVYRYRLEGRDEEWQETDDSDLRFPALEAGSYRLQVVAYDRRLHESSEPLVLSFEVLEPWWRRGWFRGLELLCLLLAGLGIWRLSVRLLIARQEELKLLVAARTKELESEKAELLSTRSALIETGRRDTLTGLLNRAAIFECMQAHCKVALETGTPLAVAMADLDSFKRVNDVYGHVVGDEVLRECARRIIRAVRPGDSVGRYGGEEMLILMPGLPPASAVARMEELRLAIAGEPIRHGGLVLAVTCSFGIAWSESEPCSLEYLVSLADAGLYMAKQNGRNRIEINLPGKTDRDAPPSGRDFGRPLRIVVVEDDRGDNDCLSGSGSVGTLECV